MRVAALAVSVLLLAMAALASRLDRSGQVLFVLLLPLPALLVHLAYRQAPRWRPDAATVGLVVATTVWVVWRAWSAIGDPRSASAVDTWPTLSAFAHAAHGEMNLLTGRYEPAVPNSLHLLLGAPAFALWPGASPLHWLQAMSSLWLGVAAIFVYWLARSFSGAHAAWIAAAVFAFSAATLWLPLTPMPTAPIVATLAALLLAYVRWRQGGSPSALVALATLGGLTIGFGHASVTVALIGLATAWHLLPRLRQVDRVVLAVALLSLTAAALPLLPDGPTLQRMWTAYVDRFLAWGVLEPVLLGQLSPEALRQPGTPPGWLDIVVGALLAPVATARTGLRLWGDVFIEPWGGVLALAGITAIVLRRVGSKGTRILCLLAAAALAPLLVSAYDRPSLIRAPALPLVVAVLAAVGFRQMAAAFGAALRPRLAAAATVLAAASGLWIFDGVNRRILPQSWLQIAHEACAEDPDGCVLLEPRTPYDLTWLHIREIGRHAARAPLRVLTYGPGDELDAVPRNGVVRAVLWSPGQEEMQGVGALLCEQAEGAHLIRLRDAAGLSHAWLLRLDPAWEPALPEGRILETASCRTAGRRR